MLTASRAARVKRNQGCLILIDQNLVSTPNEITENIGTCPASCKRSLEQDVSDVGNQPTHKLVPPYFHGDMRFWKPSQSSPIGVDKQSMPQVQGQRIKVKEKRNQAVRHHFQSIMLEPSPKGSRGSGCECHSRPCSSAVPPTLGTKKVTHPGSRLAKAHAKAHPTKWWAFSAGRSPLQKGFNFSWV